MLYHLFVFIPLSLYNALLCFCYRLWFAVHFLWYEYCYPHFLVISTCVKYLFLFPHFQSVFFFCSGLEELILLKCPYYPKQSTDSMQSLPKYPWHFSQKLNNPKIYTESQKSMKAKAIFGNKHKAGSITLLISIYIIKL